MPAGQFNLPIQIDLAATLFFSLTGGLTALKRQYDVIGLFALTFVTGVGGGLIRDGLFIQQGPPAVTSDSRYMLMIVLAGCCALLLRPRLILWFRMIAWFDSLGVRIEMESTPSALLAILVTFVLRMLAIQYNWVSPSLWSESASKAAMVEAVTEESARCTTPSPSPALRAPSPIGWERAGVRGLCRVSSRLGSKPPAPTPLGPKA